MNEKIRQALENIQNQLRQHEGKITGKELQPALEMLKKEIENNIEIAAEEKDAFDLFFEKLSYNENGKGKHPGLAFLLAAIDFHRLNKVETLKKMEDLTSQIVKEITRRMWENSELVLSPLQKISNACRDSQSFLTPKLASTYEFEIKASTLNESEKKTLIEFATKTTG